MNPKPVDFLEICNNIDFEKIKDHPNILIAANFWDEDRYKAAKTCYKLMRAIDDLVDNYKTEHTVITDEEKDRLMADVEKWISSIKSENNNIPFVSEIIETFDKFCIPIWTMEVFAKSMIYDIKNDGFDKLQSFLDYAEGASVAPAAVYVHLCGIRMINGKYEEPVFDVRDAARACAVFSYLVHIIRDFQKDQLNNLSYFADDLIEKHGLSRQKLKDMAIGSPILQGFRDLIAEYYIVADTYRQKTYDVIQKIRPLLEPRYQLSLDIIFNLYLMVFERIDIANGNFLSDELNPTPDEVKERVLETISAYMLK